MANAYKKPLSMAQRDELLQTLKNRFDKNMKRHADCSWDAVQKKLASQPAKCWSLHEMERTGGEPDVVQFDAEKNEFVFFDCAAESPAGRRSLCYDQEGLSSRKEFKPENNAVDMARDMGISLLTEAQYRYLQTLGSFDAKTSSWLATPQPIRKLGGSIFGDFRYGTVFIYHNGAQSYYAARGFRGSLTV
jgi:hypothetical protein